MRNRRDTMATGASSGGTTLITSETTVKGDITFTGQLDVEGAIEGSIQAGSGDAVLRVVSGGRVSGEIKVPHATVNGKIDGDIHSSERLILAEQAAIDGDVYYNLIEMSVGELMLACMLQFESLTLAAHLVWVVQSAPSHSNAVILKSTLPSGG